MGDGLTALGFEVRERRADALEVREHVLAAPARGRVGRPALNLETLHDGALRGRDGGELRRLGDEGGVALEGVGVRQRGRGGADAALLLAHDGFDDETAVQVGVLGALGDVQRGEHAGRDGGLHVDSAAGGQRLLALVVLAPHWLERRRGPGVLVGRHDVDVAVEDERRPRVGVAGTAIGRFRLASGSFAPANVAELQHAGDAGAVLGVDQVRVVGKRGVLCEFLGVGQPLVGLEAERVEALAGPRGRVGLPGIDGLELEQAFGELADVHGWGVGRRGFSSHGNRKRLPGARIGSV
ncbi:hypothetical protein J2753_002706 [Halolamina salifodinae]|uniref:Uncharacterized protein n=1 Tax=Halolamina salifodinae TaxID=1202767 RepID=A0A8T4H307_9EURY|nr:hypothetical protein [Halolamina salifodinae]